MEDDRARIAELLEAAAALEANEVHSPYPYPSPSPYHNPCSLCNILRLP